MTGARPNSYDLEPMLTTSQLKLIEHTILRNPYIPASIVPTKKQCQLLISTADETLYGGSVRGGKSEALLMAACQYKQLPKSDTLIVRRTRRSLTNANALVPRSHDYLGRTDASWNGSDFKWVFPNGSTITFGYLDDQKAVEQYLSSSYTDICFEEITDIEERFFNQLVSRASKDVGNPLPLRIMATCNPPTDASGDWIRNRWIERLDNDGVAESASFEIIDPETLITTKRRFIRAGLDDNPHVDREAYMRTLTSVTRLERARMLGSWTQAREGKMVTAEDLPIVPNAQQGSNVVRVRFWDFAGSKPTSKYPDPDYTAGVLMSLDTQQGTYQVEDVKMLRDTPGKVKQLVLRTAAEDGDSTMVRWYRDPAQAGKAQSHDYARALAQYDARGVPARTGKTLNFSPFAAAAGNEMITVFRAEWTTNYINSLLSFPTRGIHDDDVDATSGAYNTLAQYNATEAGAESRTHIPVEFGGGGDPEDESRRRRGLPPRNDYDY